MISGWTIQNFKTRKRAWLKCFVVGAVVSSLLGFGKISSGQEREVVVMAEDDAAGIEFFETQIQPILKQHCLKCHGDKPQELGGGLALISRKMLLDGGDSGAAVDLDDPTESLILDAINYGTYEMPPNGQLPKAKIELLSQWVKRGVPWTAATADATLESIGAAPIHTVPQVNEVTKKFWSFQPVRRPDPPAVENTAWVSNPIDRFVLAKLEAAQLSPAAPASKQALVRRVYYDLIGLPPTPQQVEAFVADDSPAAYRELVELLLASPQYGEKWGRHWLDVVRYAESNSFERDGTKPEVWRYRDYVIRAFNDDKPYDRFLLEQLAGDEIESPNAESLIATGYYRLGQWDDEPADRMQAVYDDLDDILATTSQSMLGLTVNCARCHDHKIDPIPTKDYYQMLSFFRNVRRFGVRSQDTILDASTRLVESGEPPNPNDVKDYKQKLAAVEQEIAKIEAMAVADFEPVELEDFEYVENRMRLIKTRVEKGVITKQQFQSLKKSVAVRKKLLENPPNMIRVLCVKEYPQERQTHVMVRGNPHVEGESVDPGFISVLSPPEPEVTALPQRNSSGRRLALAQWIASPQHPLTARVMVNRVWQHHFGRGIVRTSNDFGFQGAPPTHPELLDWLADEFVENSWSVKHLHRVIMSSSAYRMGIENNLPALEQDPLNKLLWRFEMRRLTAEEIRDSILAVSGRLNTQDVYGPSVFVQISEEVLAGQSMPGANWGDSQPAQANRRSIYIHVKRSLPVPMLASFDSADTDFSCPVRFNTTQPTQALGLLNSEFTNGEAEQFAAVIAGQFELPADQVREVLWRVTQRVPTDDEVAEGVTLMEQWQSEDGMSAEQALSSFCLVGFNLNEFVFLD